MGKKSEGESIFYFFVFNPMLKNNKKIKITLNIPPILEMGPLFSVLNVQWKKQGNTCPFLFVLFYFLVVVLNQKFKKTTA